MDNEIQNRLTQLGLQLPPPINPLGSYRTTVTLGEQLFVSGLGPFKDGKPVVGIVGADISIAEAQDAAKRTMLLILACVEEASGLENIERCARLTVYVRAESEFTAHRKWPMARAICCWRYSVWTDCRREAPLAYSPCQWAFPWKSTACFNSNNNVASQCRS